MILLRRILFYLFTLAYLLICPLIILYAFGYILRPNSEKGMIKTGLISLATVPSGANVYIENKRYLNKTPTVIRDLIPGNYSLSLILKDYQPASRAISVEAGKASVFERTILLPRKWDLQVLVPDNFETFIPLSGTHLFLLSKGSRLKDYFIYNWRKEIVWPLLGRARQELNNAKVLSYSQVKGSNFIFMHVVLGNKEMFIRLELRDKLTRVEDLTRFFYKLPLGVKWDPADPDNIFVLEDNHLNRIGISADGLSPKYIEGVFGYAISDKMIYLFGSDDVITKIDYEKRKSEIVYDDAKKDNSAFMRRNDFIIEPLSKESVIFCPELGELFLNFGSSKLLEKDLGGVELDPESKRLVV
ncbi:MAG: PEGA domain-containing protein, partial [Candidatus Omnitrophica bacterium]|nr:PEGA domain-containing protein [Candidatus Omnitrophota bacterium]